MLRKNRQGFTLIELMVVIVIIGVLAALAIPRFGEAATRARIAEGPRILAAFESGQATYLAENGTLGAFGSIDIKIEKGAWWNLTTGTTGMLEIVPNNIAGHDATLNTATVTIDGTGKATRTATGDITNANAFKNWMAAQ
ncbi:MAG: prepilin-type N-terminal cleavage/methylation domain-containing protein [Chitinispirillales bacterium]|jgi:prepilin-type N-terminal cleavage/methylation domain-containing protein|nr:prepilin-type N-terminal cleavage/methylation domain-containing protein [Chitinispirillales bacterium]